MGGDLAEYPAKPAAHRYRRCPAMASRQHIKPQMTDGSFFVEDLCRLSHVCVPWKSTQDAATRVVYKKCRNVSAIPSYADRTSRQEIAEDIDFNAAEGTRGVLAAWSTGKAARSACVDEPQRFSRLPDGTQFLQYASEKLHIYFAAPIIQIMNIIQRASALGLEALVADGVHDLQPDATSKLGQVYTIHGVLCNGVDVPPLFAITKWKTEATYRQVFGAMKDVMAATAPAQLQGLRVILDSERAINAARVSPGASVEGCTSIWHRHGAGMRSGCASMYARTDAGE
ncbi:hypothetical protein OSTOST_09427 [Ostertagia ostertagi]